MQRITNEKYNAMSLEELYEEQRGLYDLIESSEHKGLGFEEAWDMLLEIPSFISRKIASQDYLRIVQKKRGQEPDHCAYDDVIHEQLIA